MNTQIFTRLFISLFVTGLVAAPAFAATPTVSVISLSPSSTVSVGTPVTFAVATAGFIDPYYSLSDAFDGGSLGSADLNSAGEFSWTPYTNDVGSHPVTITAHDTQGDSATTEVTLTVQNAGSAAAVSPSASAATTTSLSIQSALPSTPAPSTTSVVYPAASVTSAGASTPTFTQNLTLGSTGAQVTALQEVLIAQGDLKATATGYYGSATQAAVKMFQSEHNVSPLGIVGPGTRAVLNSLETGTTGITVSAAVPATATTSTNATVIAEIQSEIQSITASLSQIETQIASI